MSPVKKKKKSHIANTNKQPKGNFSESDLENEIIEFPTFIVFESQKETFLAKQRTTKG